LRAFGWFLATLLAAGLIGAALAYPAYEAASHLGPWPFHRVAGRVAMLILALELLWLFRALRIMTKRDFGYGLPWPRFLTVSLLWGVLGAVTAATGAAFLLAAHLRGPSDPPFIASAASVSRLLLTGLASGISVALIEETVFRGAMHTAIERESGPLAAVLLTAPLFAITHFFAKASIPPDQLHWSSGFELLARSFAPLGHPALVIDSLLAWLAVGLILSLTRVLTGNIAVAIGLHAGWVLVLRILQESTGRGAAAPDSMWVGRFDGLLGYWLLPWAAAIGLTLTLTRSVWVPYAAGALGAIGANRSNRSMGSSISR
jgi:membrane protease YdiL (CAAX protease family)